MKTMKFRCWDKKEKRMTYLGEAGEDILHFDEGIYWTRNHDGDDYVVDDFELMQFTGLHDKKGKEIYEGDILKNKDDEIYPVMFEFNRFDAKYIIEFWHFEVIGNIYENPELLTNPGGKK